MGTKKARKTEVQIETDPEHNESAKEMVKVADEIICLIERLYKLNTGLGFCYEGLQPSTVCDDGTWQEEIEKARRYLRAAQQHLFDSPNSAYTQFCDHLCGRDNAA